MTWNPFDHISTADFSSAAKIVALICDPDTAPADPAEYFVQSAVRIEVAAATMQIDGVQADPADIDEGVRTLRAVTGKERVLDENQQNFLGLWIRAAREQPRHPPRKDQA